MLPDRLESNPTFMVQPQACHLGEDEEKQAAHPAAAVLARMTAYIQQRRFGIESEAILSPQAIKERNRRVILDEQVVEKKLAKVLNAAKERKGYVAPDLQGLWEQVSHDTFREEQFKVGNTIVKNEGMGDRFGASGIQGWRPAMEDVHMFSPGFEVELCGRQEYIGFFVGIFDGHYGSACAEYLKKEIIPHLQEKLKAFSEKYKEASETVVLWNVLTLAFVDLSERWHKTGRPERSTALIAFEFKGNLWVANVGDCSATILDGDEGHALSRKASAADESLIRGVLLRGGHIVHQWGEVPRVTGPDSSPCAVVRAVGYPEAGSGIHARSEVVRYRLTSEEPKIEEPQMLVLDSDGLGDFASNDHVANAVKAMLKANRLVSPQDIAAALSKQACEAAKAEALKYDGPPQGDNVTTLVLNLSR